MRIVPFAVSALAASLALAGCATASPEAMLPATAVPATHVEANGDTLTEYRVDGKLTMVKVVPATGVTYYLYDRNGDGRLDNGDNQGGPLTYYKLYSW